MALGRKPKAPERVRPVPRVARTPQPSSKPAFSYYNSGAGQKKGQSASSEKTVNLGAPNRLRFLPTLLALAVILLSVLYSLTLSRLPGVSTLNGQSSPYRPVEEYAAAMEKILSQDVANHTKLTVQTSAAEDALLEEFPELNAAVLRLPVLGRKPTLVLDIKPPALLLTSPLQSYVLDSSGTAITEVKRLPEAERAGLFVVQDQSGLTIELGSQVLPSDTVTFIYEVAAQLKAKELEISSLTLPVSANQLDIRLKDTAYYLKTDVSGDSRLQIGSFLAVKEKLEGEGVAPSEYIDVRVEEKVFYK